MSAQVSGEVRQVAEPIKEIPERVLHSITIKFDSAPGDLILKYFPVQIRIHPEPMF